MLEFPYASLIRRYFFDFLNRWFQWSFILCSILSFVGIFFIKWCGNNEDTGYNEQSKFVWKSYLYCNGKKSLYNQLFRFVLAFFGPLCKALVLVEINLRLQEMAIKVKTPFFIFSFNLFFLKYYTLFFVLTIYLKNKTKYTNDI